MACATSLVCLISTEKKEKEKKVIKTVLVSGHITNLQQSIYRPLISMVYQHSIVETYWEEKRIEMQIKNVLACLTCP
jgi:hypothetical protein